MRPAVFLDRDGTLHRELPQAPRHPREIELFTGVGESLAELARSRFALVVISNQSAIARGECSFDELRDVNHWIGEKLRLAGAPIERFYVCPHHPGVGSAPYRRSCECRKPARGLFQRAIAELDLDPARSWMIGDAVRDLEPAHALGARTILVRTGKGAAQEAKLAPDLRRATLVVADVPAAVAAVIAARGS